MLSSCNRSVDRGAVVAAFLVLCALGMTGCGGGGGGALPPVPDASRTSKTLAVTLVDVLGNPVEGATLTLTIGNFKGSEVSAADGVATFDFLAFGAYPRAAKADGFESLSVDGIWSRWK